MLDLTTWLLGKGILGVGLEVTRVAVREPWLWPTTGRACENAQIGLSSGWLPIPNEGILKKDRPAFGCFLKWQTAKNDRCRCSVSSGFALVL